MKFWSSIFLAAFVLLISTFVLGMSALGVDIFSPQKDDEVVGVNKLVYFFNTDDQETKQRDFIISREVGKDNPADSEKKQSTMIPVNSNQADAFEVQETPKPADTAPEQQPPAPQQPVKVEPQKKEIDFTFPIKMKANYTAVVVDQSNKIIRTFYKDFPLETGDKTIVWDKKDDSGKIVANGNYTFKLTTTSQGVPVLIYHHIADGGKGYDDNQFTETRQNFQRQMDYLYKNHYSVVSLTDVADYMQGNKALPEKAVALTFDDGYESVYNIAFDILKRYNFKATAFIIGKKAEAKSTSYTPSLNFNEMREMYQSGIFDIQSHTYDLHDAVQISPYGDFGQAITSKKYLKNEKRMETQEEYIQRITDDLRKAKEVLENNVGTKVVALSWPHGKNNEIPTEIAKGMGYKYFIEGNLGSNYMGESVENIKRVFVKKNIDNKSFSKLLNPAPKTIEVYTTTTEVHNN